MDDYPLLNLFLTMLWFFLFIAWIWLLVTLLTDVFRSKDLGGWTKALWTVFILVLPLFGALIYLIARGSGMAERMAADYQRRDEAFREYVRDAASDGAGASTADELTKLARLRDEGVLSPEEFQSQKAKLLV
ncbi:SHOCT domain-containing protein [Jiangella sp. DSM 45060]|uniref:SHOCT domain-containing protein n=1 Tax=Jiangella sp. DSM 45060 TaxID=1798224 RepID=UPI00087CDAB7|nr:SHOCT domain-containing protein [Jiangella sp. DSM 45060]SDT26596.1 Phospholipase_D-nuclease N-terminal [Jiangella sp. DSM 45060]